MAPSSMAMGFILPDRDMLHVFQVCIIFHSINLLTAVNMIVSLGAGYLGNKNQMDL